MTFFSLITPTNWPLGTVGHCLTDGSSICSILQSSYFSSPEQKPLTLTLQKTWLPLTPNCCQTCLHCYHLFKLCSSYLSEVVWPWINIQSLETFDRSKAIQWHYKSFKWGQPLYTENVLRAVRVAKCSLLFVQCRILYASHHICTKVEFLC